MLIKIQAVSARLITGQASNVNLSCYEINIFKDGLVPSQKLFFFFCFPLDRQETTKVFVACHAFRYHHIKDE